MTLNSSGRLGIPDRLFRYLDKRSLIEKIILSLAAGVFFITLILSVLNLNNQHLVEVPKTGGNLNIGVVGAPRFINPVLAITKADHDLVALTYSGIMKLDSDGNLTEDLANTITVSDDGLTYNIELKENIFFHDNTPVTAADIAFTIKLIQNPELKSPLRGNWTGVDVEVLNEREINLILDTAYTPFLENLTVGILPEHLWSDLRIEELPFSQYNTEPVGSGSYEVVSITRNENGLIDSYKLNPSDDSETYINNIEFFFFATEEDLIKNMENGLIDSTTSLTYERIKSLNSNVFDIITYPLPRTFTLFINPNRSVSLRETDVRKALSEAIDREDLIEAVTGGFGYSTQSPIPPGFSGIESDSQTSDDEAEKLNNPTDRLQYSAEILKEAGWIIGSSGLWEKEIDEATTTISLRISTSNDDLFSHIAKYLADTWKELGIDVNIEQYDQTDLVQSVIRPRNYDTLLFGTDVGRVLDLYPFWHSSQREDPGLNVALYTNITTDALLEELRTTQETPEMHDLLNQIEQEIVSDTAAIFLFSPVLVHVHKQDMHIEKVNKLVRASDRLSNIDKWYVIQDKLWKIFTN